MSASPSTSNTQPTTRVDRRRVPRALDPVTHQPLKTQVPCNPALLSLGHARKVLLLQGPLGPFFDRLTRWLHQRGAEVARIVFQGGDEYDCQALEPIRFTQLPTHWAGFLRGLLTDQGFDHLVLFGQARFYHAVAVRIAKELGVQVVVMEEGYYRPGFATMELDGVNGYSRTLERFEWVPDAPSNVGQTPPVMGDLSAQDTPRHFYKMAWHASQHYLAMRHNRHLFPHYIHHKEANPYWYARYWVWSWVKKYWYQGRDKRTQHTLWSNGQPYFFVALQHDGDAQITHHSRFRENTNFIIQVMRSFSLHAPSDAWLVFRQHPHSRGGPGHIQLIRALSQEFEIQHRVLHLVEGDTPLLAQKSQGVVLINSTVGLQALDRNAPLIALGDVLYDRDGLTFQEGLDRFWSERCPPDPHMNMGFRAQMKNLTQVPASLYAMRGEALNWR